MQLWQLSMFICIYTLNWLHTDFNWHCATVAALDVYLIERKLLDMVQYPVMKALSLKTL